ncbi:type II toxin-antitoxin system RelE/ParE family toxin [Desulfovibrio sp. JC010]|uniref:type II toxin-antitoxin system RelE/ParE family toxin n=1 Tax=Desulfovibrio sp. JC010 TaxID=2593641 RepID=UPI0013D2ADF6|nr:type II toxin-antitoxin system RelE/ParE family toxin [Desulfovibrio sp. JC010]
MKINISKAAKQDLKNISFYISENDCTEQARETIIRLRKAIDSLQQLPKRGVRVRELVALGQKSYREIFCDTYRIIYRVYDTSLRVYLVVDKRRDLLPLLTQRRID